MTMSPLEYLVDLCVVSLAHAPLGAIHVTRDRRGRAKIQLGRGHVYANKGGWQWVCRYVVMVSLGRVLRADEHVHHCDENLANDSLDNLHVYLMEYHGRYHAWRTSIAGGRNAATGRFQVVEYDEPDTPVAASRDGAIIR